MLFFAVRWGKNLLLALLLTMTAVGWAQQPWRVVYSEADGYAAEELCLLLRAGGVETLPVEIDDGALDTVSTPTVFLGRQAVTYHGPLAVRQAKDSLRDDGYLMAGDGNRLYLMGKGEKGTLYAVYAFLEQCGYRLYTPEALVVPDMEGVTLPVCSVVSNPSFRYREVRYRYPNCSQRYADWHHLHNDADRHRQWGLFVHTFDVLLPPARYYDRHPEWYAWRGDRRVRDGQLCLSNPQVLDSLCAHLADSMAAHPEKRIWSVSNNDNYNACQCTDCLHQDSLYGGPTGTLLHFVNQVARRFPDKTISTLAYQYTRQAPQNDAVRPDSNVNIMFCSIECGRELPIGSSPREQSFRRDMEDWHRLTDNIFMWDYVVQFRNYWNPFPNLHVLQPNLQFFHHHGVRMMFEQGSDTTDRSSWMDIRCYLLAKLLWNVDTDLDSVRADFCRGYYGPAAQAVQTILDTMEHCVTAGTKRLDIYGFPSDAAETYLTPERMRHYYRLLDTAYRSVQQIRSAQQREEYAAHLDYFRLALDFARIDLSAGGELTDYLSPDNDTAQALSVLQDGGGLLSRLLGDMRRFGVPKIMERGVTPEQYAGIVDAYLRKSFGHNLAAQRPVALRREPTAPYRCREGATLTDRRGGILDYRHDWLGFWGDTLDAAIEMHAADTVRQLALDFYYYPLSWIFLPRRVVCLISEDGLRWEQVGEQTPADPQTLDRPEIYTVTFPLGNRPARYLRVVAEPMPEIPAWHRAYGQKPWLFCDEVVVE